MHLTNEAVYLAYYLAFLLTDRKAVETIDEYFPKFNAVPSLTFLVESIDPEIREFRVLSETVHEHLYRMRISLDPF